MRNTITGKEKEEMKNSKIEQTVVLSLLVLMTISGLTLGVSSTFAQENAKSASYIFVTATPNPIGQGQNIGVVVFMSAVTPDAVEHTGSRWQGVTVDVTKPDGSTETKGPFTLDAVASTFFMQPADMLGTYSFKAKFPGQTIPPFFNPLGLSSDVPIDYGPDESPVVTVTVTTTPALAPYDIPLPTGYWTRPISGMNHNWWQISSNWLMPAWGYMARQFDQGSAYAPYSQAPDSAHVLWTTPITFGGLPGGEFGGTSFHNGMSYEQFFKPPVIISGRIYYNTIVANEPTAAGLGTNSYTTTTYEDQSSITCLDLATGKTIMTIPQASLSFGQIYNYISPNQGGTFAYLWDTNGPEGTWKMYDAWTGQYLLSLKNVPAAGQVLLNSAWGGPGEIIIYSLNSTTGELSMWNSTRVLLPLTPVSLNPASEGINALVGQNPFTWRPEAFLGQTLDSTGVTEMTIPGFFPLITKFDTNGIQWTKKLDNFPAGGAIQQVAFDTIWVMAGTGNAGQVFTAPLYETWASYSMTDGSQKSGPANINLVEGLPPNASSYFGGISGQPFISKEGILPIYVKETLQFYAFDLKTGSLAWGPTEALTNAWGIFNWQSDFIADNVFYNWGFDGMVHAWDAATGTKLFDFDAGSAGSLNPYGVNALYQGILVADGKLYAQTGDHGNGAQPLYQGEWLYCMEAKTGKSLWTMSGWFTQPALADGIMLSQNLYDNQIWAFGKGPSSVTVTAPNVGVPAGEKILIQGTVTDQSPGKTCFGVPTAGTPAVSDASMSDWMAYLYGGQPKPSATGVPVKVSATASDGSTTDIGTVISDANGQFKIEWTPGSSGLFTVNAEFLGTNSYYISEAHTGLSIGSAHPTTTTTTTSNDNFVWYLVAATIVLLIAIVAAVIVLRKK
jgi:hypothetical protein